MRVNLVRERDAKVRRMVEEFIDLTDQMNELKDACREVAAQREQLALRLSETHLYLYQIGRMVGLAAPTLCRLAQKAKERNGTREDDTAGDDHPRNGRDQRGPESGGHPRPEAG